MTPPPTEHTHNPQNSQKVKASELELPEHPKRVLVADDELLVVQGVVSSLKALELEIVGPCKNGEEAVKICREDRPDIALLDIQMPK